MNRLNHLILILVLLAAFGARLGVRIAFGEDDFWQNSYSSYYQLAENFVSEKAFASVRCARNGHRSILYFWLLQHWRASTIS